MLAKFLLGRYAAPLVLSFVLGMILLTSAWTYNNIQSFAETAQWVVHTREVTTVTEQLSSALTRADSAGRGFWISRNPQFHDDLDHAISQVDNRLAKLRSLTDDNAWQRKKLDELETQVGAVTERLNQFVTSRDAILADSAEEIDMLETAEALIAPAQQSIAEIKQHEDALLQVRTERFQQRLSRTRWNLLFSSLLAVSLVSLAYFALLHVWSLQRKSAEDSATFAREKGELSRYNERLLESTGEGIYGIDVNGCCTFMNTAAAKMLAGKTRDFFGKNLHGMIHHTHDTGEHYDEVDCPIYKSAKSGESCMVDEEVFWKLDGQSFPVEYSSSPIKSGNKIDGAVVTFKDVTEQRHARTQLQLAKESAEAANESKSQFLANMSHELRTPLNAVIMYSELLSEEAEDQNVPGFIPDLNRIRAAGKHLLELVNGVLDLSKIDAGKMELFAEEIDLHSMIDDVVATMTPMVDANRNKLMTEIDDSLETMTGDLTKLRQVLFNLTSNASKFTTDGTIWLAVQRASSSDQIRFSVSDSGIGMTEEQVARLFQPFMQADVSTTRRYGGTGLGLAIIKRFTDLMHGEVTVSSQLGVGTTFEVTLPINLTTRVNDELISNSAMEAMVQTSDATTAIENPSPGDDRPQVLVIDDDPAVIDIVRRILSSEGVSTIAAQDGEEGLRLASETQPAVIILDVHLPKIDGWSILVKLKSDDRLSDIPVIMQSGNDRKELGFMLGAFDYLVKPVNRARLVTLMRRLVLNDEASILVVDDDPTIQRALSRSLRKEGWQVELASNGAEALVAVDRERPAAIILDLTMPVMDGLEFLELFRANVAWSEIPVIVSTSKTLTDDDRMRLRGTVEKVVAKGAVSREGLVQEVRRIVKKSIEPTHVSQK